MQLCAFWWAMRMASRSTVGWLRQLPVKLMHNSVGSIRCLAALITGGLVSFGNYFRAWGFFVSNSVNLNKHFHCEFIHSFIVSHPSICLFFRLFNQSKYVHVRASPFLLNCIKVLFVQSANIVLFSQLCFRLPTDLFTVFGSGVLAVITGSARSDLSWTLTLRAKCGPQMAFMPQSPISTQQTR